MSDKKALEEAKLEAKKEKLLVDIVNRGMGINSAKTWVFGVLVGLLVFTTGFNLVEEYTKEKPTDKGFIAVVDIEGAITTDNHNNAYARIPLLEKAFEFEHSKAIFLTMNSGGGSPSQAQIIHDRILALKEEHKKPVIAIVDDMCASACYLIATAADEIFINKLGVAGSIGVLMPSWDFTEVMEKVGVKQDSLHAGKYKMINSPYQPKNPEVTEFLKENILSPLHQEFINTVMAQRSGKIDPKSNKDSDVFSGLIWTGEAAVEMGLADSIGDTYSVRDSKEEWKELGFVNMEPPINNLKRLLTTFGSDVAVESIEQALEQKFYELNRIQ